MSRNVGLKEIEELHEPLQKRLLYALHRPKTLEEVMLVIAVLYPFTLAPQILKIYVEHDASGVSILSVVLRVLFALPWIYYGHMRKSQAVVVTNTLWALGYLLILGQVATYA